MSKTITQKEIWKAIKGYEGYYEVSNLGNVKRIHVGKGTAGGIVKTYFGNGYLKVDLYVSQKRKKCYIHRLVAEAFISNKNNKPQINHIDSNRANNSLNNLEWTTQKDNMVHMMKSGRGKGQFTKKI
jgi:hypothetical protein